ncbi:hypothetical protein SJ05684_c01050 [Sinorhizobium sojae CCBAU 05684]|uniref:Uncharacterized protein n=1 Tax=Sinorhizobium sojae CCBAU 05684 TaxID=716928 RepID=A0A249P783_9HYPH|nr:hypothetical protein SJ05684_c01050 [Sinorhizobium sojae CCBAU 05684]
MKSELIRPSIRTIYCLLSLIETFSREHAGRLAGKATPWQCRERMNAAGGRRAGKGVGLL